jgi:peptide/nickel transport system ATP-binding protein
MSDDLLLEVKGLKTYFFTDLGVVKAVDGVTFDIKRSKTLGVLGESGCGKSVTGFSILQLIQKPGRIVEGQILYHRQPQGDDVSQASEVVDITQLKPHSAAMREIRGGEISLVFQEPMTSLDPMYTVGSQIMEGIILHQDVDKAEARLIATDMLRRVNLPDPAQVLDRYPHQLSGGMRQRCMIAAALACRPSLLIADEPTTALDVTTEAQILELMNELQREFGMAIMYITHNLGVIAEMVEDAIVMYLGRVVERADVDTIFEDPRHPYLQALLHSIPRLGTKSSGRLEAISGMVPNPRNMPPGCSFHPRCSRFMQGLCDKQMPEMTDLGNGHLVRCWLYSA